MSDIGKNARRAVHHAAEIAGGSYAYPSDLVDNDEYLRRCRFKLSSDRETLINDTGLKTRRWCLPHESTSTLVRSAIAKLMEREPALCEEIDAVVVASGTTMTMAHPSDPNNRAFADLAPLVLKQLGKSDALGLDIKACYCTGFLRGMQVVDGLLSNANYRSVLLVAAEQGSRFATAESNRSSFCFIVSDGAGAVVFRRRELTPDAKRVGILDYCGFTDVSKLDWVGIGEDAASIIMMGSSAAGATLEMLAQCARTLLHRNGLTPSNIDWMIPIQTHRGLLSELLRVIECPPDKLLWSGDVNGFSGSASIPTCLVEEIERGRVKKGDLILSLAVGAGMNAAGCLYIY